MYCNSEWDGLNETFSDKLQKLQNPARIIKTSSYDANTDTLLEMLL